MSPEESLPTTEQRSATDRRYTHRHHAAVADAMYAAVDHVLNRESVETLAEIALGALAIEQDRVDNDPDYHRPDVAQPVSASAAARERIAAARAGDDYVRRLVSSVIPRTPTQP